MPPGPPIDQTQLKARGRGWLFLQHRSGWKGVHLEEPMENTHTWRWQGNFKNEEKEGRRGGCREGVGEGKQEEEGEEQEEQEQREWGSFKWDPERKTST